MKKIIHRNQSRGVAEHGWLHSKHTFSFANYYNPERMGFGKLRVLNDDVIEPAAGFGTHPHDNMEIVSVPISGELRHADTMGNEYVIRENEVQVMSAGTGIAHSEYNNSDTAKANFLQIWVLPKHLNIKPRYEQKSFNATQKHNQFLPVVSPDEANGSLSVNQDAWFHLGDFDSGKQTTYHLHRDGNGLYVFVIAGEVKIDNEVIEDRDAIGITGTDKIAIQALKPANVLTIEVPMN